MVPRMMGRERMKPMPAPKRCHIVPCVGPAAVPCATGTRSTSATPSAKQAQHMA